jgi:hypothetical protein
MVVVFRRCYHQPFNDLWWDETMANDILIKGAKAKKGERMTSGEGWRLATTRGRKRVFVGTLLHTINMGRKRIAIFSVPK